MNIVEQELDSFDSPILGLHFTPSPLPGRYIGITGFKERKKDRNFADHKLRSFYTETDQRHRKLY